MIVLGVIQRVGRWSLRAYWTGWSKAMRNHRWSVKGKSVQERAATFIDHCVAFSISLAGGGDVSAWDTSWSAEVRSLSVLLDKHIMGPAYAKVTSDVYLKRAAVSRQVRLPSSSSTPVARETTAGRMEISMRRC